MRSNRDGGATENLTRASDLFHLVQHLSAACLLLSQTGRVLFANARARALLDGSDGVCWRGDGVLGAEDSKIDKALAEAVANAVNAPQSAHVELVVRRRGGAWPLLILISPFPRIAANDGPSACIFLLQGDAPPRPDLGPRLRALFRLTAAEIEVAMALIMGASIEAIAEQRRTARHTVRAQVKSVLAKTGAEKQADLVRLLRYGDA